MTLRFATVNKKTQIIFGHFFLFHFSFFHFFLFFCQIVKPVTSEQVIQQNEGVKQKHFCFRKNVLNTFNNATVFGYVIIHTCLFQFNQNREMDLQSNLS